MISMLAYSGQSRELTDIRNIARNQAALFTDDRWEFFLCDNLESVEALGGKKLDAICFDVTKEENIRFLEGLRERNRKAYIILIASPETSPVLYMKPTVMAASLLLRPLQSVRIEDAVRTLLITFEGEERLDEEILVLEGQDGRERVDCRDILYFEARAKKIYACTASREYGFYDTLDQLESRLPDYFLRVHRGFIVNVNYIARVVLSEGFLHLEDGITIPLSRSYRQIVKKWRQEGRIR